MSQSKLKDKHKAMSYGSLKSREAELSTEIDELINKASLSDQQEDDTYKEANDYSIPEDLQFTQERLKKMKAAKEAFGNSGRKFVKFESARQAMNKKMESTEAKSE
ncbi:hypothetical protein [Salinisphaera sp. G21_0]|uniref:hypothetical protein n=1 Tax=Salinisphaera sp. G21_0 TaxID=2821094 RepID=UPI001ADB9147|nr:hypothetical protein [Salinisphaera sp. G21_0]MBO9481313.1 hypothetical protein [Salinisphaera sp. G21_0]